MPRSFIKSSLPPFTFSEDESAPLSPSPSRTRARMSFNDSDIDMATQPELQPETQSAEINSAQDLAKDDETRGPEEQQQQPIFGPLPSVTPPPRYGHGYDPAPPPIKQNKRSQEHNLRDTGVRDVTIFLAQGGEVVCQDVRPGVIRLLKERGGVTNPIQFRANPGRVSLPKPGHTVKNASQAQSLVCQSIGHEAKEPCAHCQAENGPYTTCTFLLQTLYVSKV
ncbi:hypothetical protein AAP_04944 [Ascosphaera apis ARSEF 7405]|uniref:Uncharacterized protein n=1 Tax=Ascosphaera apis ARSEF 7405 TaxID=392613 RepID=A0A167W3Y4_9EURO|nr:hypothetical protein AAP_04944 [Ascosphaera apis ARSEF 7405]